jgi:hypothetical protein
MARHHRSAAAGWAHIASSRGILEIRHYRIGTMTDDENPAEQARYSPATVAERTAKGTSAAIVASQADATAAKTARLRAAREERDAAQAIVDAEALRSAPPKKIVKRRKPDDDFGPVAGY